VTFEEEEQDGKTKLTSESFFQTVEDRDIMLNLRVVDVRQKAWIV
jgi:hypothetical protein